MCLVLFAKNAHPKYKLVIAANRDEYYNRPTEKMKWWDGYPSLLAGKDLRQGGTWMGITKEGRVAAITNFRDRNLDKKNPVTRGKIVLDYLTGDISSKEYLNSLNEAANDYNGFNILAGNTDELYYFTNSTNTIREVPDGIHGLSNGTLNEPWHKVVLGKELFKTELDKPELSVENLMSILSNKTKAEDGMLPDTGIGKRLERMVSPIFIKTPLYGTRCSTIVFIGNDNRVYVKEKRFNAFGSTGESEYSFEIQP